MKKNLIFTFTLLIYSLLGYSVLAQIVLPNPLSVNSFQELFANAANYVFGFIGALAILVFVWAGVLFITSAGNAGQIDKAKKALLYAVIGSAIALAGTGLIELVKSILGI